MGPGPWEAQDYGYGHQAKGTPVHVARKVAPSADPVEVTVRGYELSSARRMEIIQVG